MIKTIFLLVGGVVMLCFGFWGGCREESFLRASATTTGVATSKPIQRRYGTIRSEHTRYSFHYTFTVDGKNYEAWTDAAEDPSDTFTVYYERANPSNSRIYEPDPTIGWKLAGLGLFGIFIGSYCFYSDKKRAA